METDIKANQRVRVRNKRIFITLTMLVPLSKFATKAGSPAQTWKANSKASSYGFPISDLCGFM